MSLYLGDQIISGQTTLVGESRNIGQIIPSAIPLTDAGVHLLDGALIQGSGIYSAFVTRIAGLVSTYPNLFVTESDWQTALSTYGVCGKFVYDSTNNTVRLPKTTGKLDGTTDVNALGDLKPLLVKLPNITGTLNGTAPGGFVIWDNAGSGSLYNNYTSASYTPYMATSGSVTRSSDSSIRLDASRSSSVYSGNGTDTTIHEQAINVLLYIVIATSTKTDIEVDIDQYITDFNAVQHSADDAVTTANTASNQVDSWRNSLAEVKCVIETYSSGTSWYRIWSDGWCEQGGNFGSAYTGYTAKTINLLKNYSSLNYTITAQDAYLASGSYSTNCVITNKTQSSFTLRDTINASGWGNWQACGYIN